MTAMSASRALSPNSRRARRSSSAPRSLRSVTTSKLALGRRERGCIIGEMSDVLIGGIADHERDAFGCELRLAEQPAQQNREEDGPNDAQAQNPRPVRVTNWHRACDLKCVELPPTLCDLSHSRQGATGKEDQYGQDCFGSAGDRHRSPYPATVEAASARGATDR